jgi:hypothetical protein
MGYRAFVHFQVGAALLTLLGIAAICLSQATDGTRSATNLAFAWLWAYGIPLAVAVLAVMFERAASGDAILGHAEQSRPASLARAVLQNTLEQTVLAVIAVFAFAGSAPNGYGVFVPAAACVFLAGRVLFWLGYAWSPMYRFYGFALNFYASCALLAFAAWFHANGG